MNLMRAFASLGLSVFIATATAITATGDEKKDAAELPLIFNEDLSDFNRIFKEFKSVRSGEQELSLGKSWTWRAGVALVRPLRIGPEADLTVKLQLPDLAKEGDSSETRFGFVFAHEQIGSVALVRQRDKEKIRAELRVVRQVARAGTETVLRSQAVDGDLSSGTWLIKVRAGAVVIWRNDVEVAAGSLETHNIPIVGLAFSQESGQATIERIALRGSAFPTPLPADQAAVLQRASAINEEGKKFYQDKNFDQAALKTKEALELYRKLYPDGHSDLSNSLYNVGVVLRDAGDKPGAISHLQEAVHMRRKLFGEDHPQTALLEMELATVLTDQGQLATAFEHCLRAHFSFVKYFGSEYPPSRATGALLEKLPKPQPKSNPM